MAKLIVSIHCDSWDFYKLYDTIVSLQNQTYIPDKILLSVVDEEVVNIPSEITVLISENHIHLNIVHTTVGENNVFYPIYNNYNRDYFVVLQAGCKIDDRLLERYVLAAKKHPDCVIAGQVLRVYKDKCEYYSKEGLCDTDEGYLPLMTGGILYPPHSLDNTKYGYCSDCERDGDICRAFVTANNNFDLYCVIPPDDNPPSYRLSDERLRDITNLCKIYPPCKNLYDEEHFYTDIKLMGVIE